MSRVQSQFCKCQFSLLVLWLLLTTKPGLAKCSPWQQKVLFLNGNLAEKRRTERLRTMAHLLLARSAQSLPLEQPESRLYLLAAVPAEPLLGTFPGMAGWAPAAGGNPMVAVPSFTTSLSFHPILTLLAPKVLSHYFASSSPALLTHLPFVVLPLWAYQALVLPHSRLTHSLYVPVFLKHLSIRPFPPLHLQPVHP